MAEPALLCEGLDYRYPEAPRLALDGIDLEIAPGEFVVLAGRSGSGKSTLLRAACGLVPHFHGGEIAGEMRVGGRSTRDTGPAELASAVGFVAQEPETQVVSTTVGAELEHLKQAGSAFTGTVSEAHYLRARILMHLKEEGAALHALEESMESSDSAMVLTLVDSTFKPLANERRYQTVLDYCRLAARRLDESQRPWEPEPDKEG